MNFQVKDKSILLSVPAANDGKFRFKKRRDPIGFGETFSTRKGLFDADVYLEWQIGYDVLVKDVKEGKSKTKLTAKEFTGSNGKRKYPYELSELFYEALNLGLFNRKETQDLVFEIKAYQNFIDDKVISLERHSSLTVNELGFEETSLKLPTFFMTKTSDKTQIEISIQKQQYASGVQPMIYFCIPIGSFANYRDIMDRSSLAGDELVYVIDKNNVSNLAALMRIFGMASRRHNQDVIGILGVILDITQ